MKEYEIPIARKEPNWCGPATLAWVAYEQGLPYPDQAWLASKIYDPLWGTDGEAMVKGLELLGLKGVWRQNIDLEVLFRMKKAGYSIILSWMNGANEKDDGHYSTLLAADEKTVTLNDTELVGMIKTMRRVDFEKVWYDMTEEGYRQEKWALIIENPSSGIRRVASPVRADGG